MNITKKSATYLTNPTKQTIPKCVQFARLQVNAIDYDRCRTYREALQRRYGKLNWLDQVKHDKYIRNNAIPTQGPTLKHANPISFDGETISADLLPDLIRIINE